MWGSQRCIPGFWWGDLKEINYLEDPAVDGRTTSKRIFKKWDEIAWTTFVAQDKGAWRALVNAVMNFRVPQNARDFLTSCGPVSFLKRTLLHRIGIKVALYLTV
jgi:hypothetical protein